MSIFSSDSRTNWAQAFISGIPYAAFSSMQVVEIGQGFVTLLLPARATWTGDTQRNLIHAGCLSVLADTACGLAVGSAMEEMEPFATLDLRMDYLRPAGPGHDVSCDAHCFRLTRNVAFVRAEVYQSDREQPIAVAQASFMLSTPGGQRAPRETAGEPDAAAWQPPPGSEPVLAGTSIPYVDYLGIRAAGADAAPLFRLPYQDKLIGNPQLPALHGGVIAGFAETAATLHLIRTLRGAKFPKSIDFSIDYLRSGRPVECFAACEVVRVGSRVALVQVRCWQQGPDKPIAVARGHFLLTAPELKA